MDINSNDSFPASFKVGDLRASLQCFLFGDSRDSQRFGPPFWDGHKENGGVLPLGWYPGLYGVNYTKYGNIPRGPPFFL